MNQDVSKIKPLFRENAINNLNSINEIQSTLKVISPASWMWVLTSFFLILGIFTVGVFGKVTMNIPASGILIPADQLQKIDKIMNENLKVRQERLYTIKELLEKKKILYKKHYLMLEELERAEEDYLLAKEDFLTSTSERTFVPPVTSQNNASDQAIDALVFVNHKEGKKVVVGMKAYVLPSTVSAYEYGYMKGSVLNFS